MKEDKWQLLRLEACLLILTRIVNFQNIIIKTVVSLEACHCKECDEIRKEKTKDDWKVDANAECSLFLF